MKKLISCLLAVMLLVSLSVSAFAVSAVKEVVSGDVSIAEVEVTDELIEGFDAFFESSAELQAAAGEYGVKVGSAFSAAADAFPASAVLKVEDAADFIALVMTDGESFTFIPSTLAGDELSAELPAAETYLVVSKVTIGPASGDDNAYVVKTPSTWVNSAEVKGEPVLVKATAADGEDIALLIVTPFDKKYTVEKTGRDRFDDEVDGFVEGFDQFMADHPEFAETAPSDAVYLSSNKPAELKLPATITLEIEDSDIFAALLLCENNTWKQVNAKIDASGNLVFSASKLGSYVILSQAAAD